MLIKDREMLKWIMQKSKKMHNGDQYRFYTMKEDRGMILKRQNNQFIVEEFGYQNQTIIIDDDTQLKKIIKQVHQVEFPRSNNVKVKG